VIVDGVRFMGSDKTAASNRLGDQHRDQTAAHHHKWAKVLQPIEIWLRSGSELHVSLRSGSELHVRFILFPFFFDFFGHEAPGM